MSYLESINLIPFTKYFRGIIFGHDQTNQVIAEISYIGQRLIFRLLHWGGHLLFSVPSSRAS